MSLFIIWNIVETAVWTELLPHSGFRNLFFSHSTVVLRTGTDEFAGLVAISRKCNGIFSMEIGKSE